MRQRRFSAHHTQVEGLHLETLKVSGGWEWKVGSAQESDRPLVLLGFLPREGSRPWAASALGSAFSSMFEGLLKEHVFPLEGIEWTALTPAQHLSRSQVSWTATVDNTPLGDAVSG